MIQIIAFYKFKQFAIDELEDIKLRLKELMAETGMRGTILLAEEGFNSTLSGTSEAVEEFVPKAEVILGDKLVYKSSFHDSMPFRKIDVKIKPEIVTLRKKVDISKGKGTHISADRWNEIISDPEVFVLDTRNDYEFETGTFENAVNPGTEKFSELPEFIEKNLDPAKHKKVAMFCTGGIRCEKFAPYLVEQGFQEVFQLEGGILKYLEETDPKDSLWQGECFIFDERRTLDHELKKGEMPDISQRGIDMAKKGSNK